MNKEQFRDLTKVNENVSVIKGSDLTDQTPRILLYGYTVDRVTFKVELLADGTLETQLGNSECMFRKNQESININSQYVPDKRVYPHKSDYEFCKLLKERGVYISFTTFE